MFSYITDLDVSILYYVQDHFRTEWLNIIVSYFTSLGNYGLIWIMLTVGLLLFDETRKTGVICAVALILDLIICNGILKNVFQRIRPYDAYNNIRCLVKPQPDYSFPSGHTASSFAVAAAILYHEGLNGFDCIVVAVAILMAASRIYVCVHYPSDILAGIVVGIFCGIMSCVLYNIYEKRLHNK